MQEPVQKFTPQQLAGLKESAIGIRKMIRLINSGPGGVAQLKRELKERLEFVDLQIFVAERDQA